MLMINQQCREGVSVVCETGKEELREVFFGGEPGIMSDSVDLY